MLPGVATRFMVVVVGLLLVLFLCPPSWMWQPSKPLRAPRVPGVVPQAAVGALRGGGLILLVPPDALFCRVWLAAHSAPGGVLAESLEVIVALALVTPDRLAVIGA